MVKVHTQGAIDTATFLSSRPEFLSYLKQYMKDGLIEALMSTSPDDAANRERLYFQMKAVDDLFATIASIANYDGGM